MNEIYEHHKQNIVNEYNFYSEIGKILNITRVESTDGNFTQIGRKSRIPTTYFYDDKYPAMLRDFGRVIAISEKKYLVNRILKSKEIEKITISKKQLLENIFELVRGMRLKDLVILLPTNLKFKMMEKEMANFDYKLNTFIYHYDDIDIPIYTVPDKILKNKMIILNRSFAKLEMKRFNGNDIDVVFLEDSKQAETIIETKTVLKLDILNDKLAKVINFVNIRKNSKS